MLGLLPDIGFLNPGLLFGLLLLPLFWWLMKLTPPRPAQIWFPPLRILRKITDDETSAASLPLWLLLLRLLLIAVLILALAGPVYNPVRDVRNSGALVIVIDDSFAAAPGWPLRRKTAISLVDEASRNNRPLYVTTTAASRDADSAALSPLSHDSARALISKLKPKAWAADRSALMARLNALPPLENADIFWLADGLTRENAKNSLPELIAAFDRHGTLRVFVEDAADLPVMIETPTLQDGILHVPLKRFSVEGSASHRLIARENSGKISADIKAQFAPSENTVSATINLPSAIRNRIDMLTLPDAAHAGGTYLMDPRWLRRPVGLLDIGEFGAAQPLLSETHYLKNALLPYFDIYLGDHISLLKRPLSVLVMGDRGDLGPTELGAVRRWITSGGVLLRFSGPRLAASSQQLVPTRLRKGNRTLDGAMSWTKPAEMGPFPKHSPFASLDIPADIRIDRQVLAEPSPDLRKKSWAVLSDGTPLVTAQQMGDGWLVLFHISATPKWSNLALSGLFVEMLKKTGDLGLGVQGNISDLPLEPVRILDGFGRLSSATGTIAPLGPDARKPFRPGPETPPGIYGHGYAKTAFNFSDSPADYVALAPLLPASYLGEYVTREARPLMPLLLLIGFILLLADQLLLLWLNGKFRFPGHVRTDRTAALLTLILLSGLAAIPKSANADDLARILAATNETRLAYILTGNAKVDALSKAGLNGLSQMLLRRTSVETRRPMAIDIEQHELTFYPMVYWPVTADLALPSDAAQQKLNRYMKLGGTVIFDTRNQNMNALFGGATADSPQNKALQRLLAKLDVPRLTPVDGEHVLTRAFYLMQEFPGRYTGGKIWVEDTSQKTGNDGVASLIIGAHDWAAAWATDKGGLPLAAVIPGGERQRELAFRFGINLVMYVLTGNYKSDQVHLSTIVERLGQ